MRRVSGFTIVELIVVIVILGILAAVALPRFMDFSNEARTAAAAGAAGAIASGAVVNYSARLISNTAPASGNATVINTCTTASLGLALSGGEAAWPKDIVVTAGSLTTSMSNGATGTCLFYHSDGGTTATASIIAVTN